MNLTILLDNTSAIPLYSQLYRELRRAILSGRLAGGMRLPSSRSLAISLRVSRTTVTQCYEDLISEGYLQAIQGSGTFVCRNLPDQLLKAVPPKLSGKPSKQKQRPLVLSSYTNRILDTPRTEQVINERIISFGHWHPAFDHLPLAIWRRLIARHSRSVRDEMFDYSKDCLGYRPLREAVTSYLRRSRAVRCETSQLVICSGAQRAVDLITHLLVDPGDLLAMEDPGYLGARHVFAVHGAKLLAVPVDDSGIVVDQLKKRSSAEIKVVYVSPSHQFPTGVLMSLPRRLELLDWASRQNAFVIEDDYDSEYRYGGRPVPALQGLDENERVIYVGSFSKVMFPSLRLGYVVLPKSLVKPFARVKSLVDRQSPLLEQYALADFINEGHLERHIRRMRTLYDYRRRTLVRALRERLDRNVSIIGDNAGMHLMARLITNVADRELVARAASKGLGLVSARSYYLCSKYNGEFIFGYSNLSERTIREGVRKLAEILN